MFSFVAQSHNRNSVILRGGIIRLGSGLTGVLINATNEDTHTLSKQHMKRERTIAIGDARLGQVNRKTNMYEYTKICACMSRRILGSPSPICDSSSFALPTVRALCLCSIGHDRLVRCVREVDVPHNGENVRAQDLEHR